MHSSTIKNKKSMILLNNEYHWEKGKKLCFLLTDKLPRFLPSELGGTHAQGTDTKQHPKRHTQSLYLAVVCKRHMNLLKVKILIAGRGLLNKIEHELGRYFNSLPLWFCPHCSGAFNCNRNWEAAYSPTRFSSLKCGSPPPVPVKGPFLHQVTLVQVSS